jgi:hypothetical protein
MAPLRRLRLARLSQPAKSRGNTPLRGILFDRALVE